MARAVPYKNGNALAALQAVPPLPLALDGRLPARNSRGSKIAKRAPRTDPSGPRIFSAPDSAAGSLDDLPADTQAEAGVLPERLAGRPLRIEALEDIFLLARRNAGPLIPRQSRSRCLFPLPRRSGCVRPAD